MGYFEKNNDVCNQKSTKINTKFIEDTNFCTLITTVPGNKMYICYWPIWHIVNVGAYQQQTNSQMQKSSPFFLKDKNAIKMLA